MIKGYIIIFFLDQQNQQKNTAQALIFILLNSPNEQFCLYVLVQMYKLIMKKKIFIESKKTNDINYINYFSKNEKIYIKTLIYPKENI